MLSELAPYGNIDACRALAHRGLHCLHQVSFDEPGAIGTLKNFVLNTVSVVACSRLSTAPLSSRLEAMIVFSRPFGGIWSTLCIALSTTHTHHIVNVVLQLPRTIAPLQSSQGCALEVRLLALLLLRTYSSINISLLVFSY